MSFTFLVTEVDSLFKLEGLDNFMKIILPSQEN